MKLFPIILAAGKGTRMYSELPKVLHTIGGQPMLQHVIASCQTLLSTSNSLGNITVVYGHGGELVKETIANDHINWVVQAEQKGTGHAVDQARDLMDDDCVVIIAYGDVPLIKADTLQALVDALHHADLTVLTTVLDDPSGYGRIVRNEQGTIQGITEDKDADAKTKKIAEINTGFIAAKGKDLKRWLSLLSPDNAQGEYYLTDCIASAVAEGGNVDAVRCDNAMEVQGVNDRTQQAQLEREYQKEQANKLMLAGVSLADPARIDIRGKLHVGKDVFIDVNTIFTGEVTLGNNVTIEAGCVITASIIADNATIKPHSVLENAYVGEHCHVGPFARLRPNAVLKANAKVGNFVEIKKSIIGEGSKVSHLSYIGDTKMGSNVNIGAGTITCNYDGANKFETIIGNDAFIGSDSQLVAPVEIGDGATIGAGSTITKNTPANELTFSRAKQVTIKGWKRPVKQTKK
ncbi:MAG TPA: UDP-N-acetylglucosamine diphosphorylase/glucosamine-1-phosphate N-acetyltransferase [Leucothrix mucor]|uniref:Bifunctional protein GlmU n=1 Tax=Leucothrix mucor TaxID=45248 RepID=A0A7V2T385_LEUMU|nr:UDP-N-acetylglucosamine diphosphorylase/glucosamine-1-phosphate N-acetyltransferase [Leucothrix mucor]